MMVRLKVLPNALRGGAWPSSASAVRYPVKSGNWRDPHLLLLAGSSESVHTGETAGDKPEEGASNDRSVCPEFPGLHADYNAYDRGLRRRKAKPIPKRTPSSDRGL